MPDSIESDRRLVLIGGPSGSGKSLLAHALAQTMGRDSAVLIAIDDYYRDLGHLELHERATANFDHPGAIEWSLVHEHVSLLLAGETVSKPRYNFATHSRLAETEPVPAKLVIILEGLHALTNSRLVDIAHCRVYVEATREVCLGRRLARDTQERGRSVDDVHRQFEETVWPMAEQFLTPARAHADVTVDGAQSVEASVAEVLRHLNGL